MRSGQLWLCIVALSTTASIALGSQWKVQVLRTPSEIKFLRGRPLSQSPFVEKSKYRVISSRPYFLKEDAPPSKELYQEIITDEALLPSAFKSKLAKGPLQGWPGSEVKTLVNQGPINNRINLTIVGDGYTSIQKDKFFADAQRTTDELFKGHTFASYLPLFNVFAVFVPSTESGIGDGSPKNTALRLFRDPKGSKRAIMPGDSAAAERAIDLAPATDYPILLANDEFYGGLGGRYAISTSSVKSGMMVLRHELGHNFGDVGEEYDGGYVYSGANSSDSENVHWNYWAEGSVHVNTAFALAGEYLWKNLATGPVNINYNFPPPRGGAFRLLIDISSVGWESPEDVQMSLDGKILPLVGQFTRDRYFYEIGPVSGFEPGQHQISFQEMKQDGDNVLAFVRAYALASDYDLTKDKIGAYMTYDIHGTRSYRPTHDSCLMRNMLTPNFCNVDKENMWVRFLTRVNLIDSVETNSFVPTDRTISLKCANLNGLGIAWFQKNGTSWTELPDLRGKKVWQASGDTKGSFKVVVRFQTPEVRKYTKNFISEKSFEL